MVPVVRVGPVAPVVRVVRRRSCRGCPAQAARIAPAPPRSGHGAGVAGLVRSIRRAGGARRRPGGGLTALRQLAPPRPRGALPHFGRARGAGDLRAGGLGGWRRATAFRRRGPFTESRHEGGAAVPRGTSTLLRGLLTRLPSRGPRGTAGRHRARRARPRGDQKRPGPRGMPARRPPRPRRPSPVAAQIASSGSTGRRSHVRRPGGRGSWAAAGGARARADRLLVDCPALRGSPHRSGGGASGVTRPRSACSTPVAPRRGWTRVP